MKSAHDKAKAYVTNQRYKHRPIRIRHVMSLTGWSEQGTSRFLQSALHVTPADWYDYPTRPKAAGPYTRKTDAQKQAETLRRIPSDTLSAQEAA